MLIIAVLATFLALTLSAEAANATGLQIAIGAGLLLANMLLGVLILMIKDLRTSDNRQWKEIGAFKVDIARNYVRKEDLKLIIAGVVQGLLTKN